MPRKDITAPARSRDILARIVARTTAPRPPRRPPHDDDTGLAPAPRPDSPPPDTLSGGAALTLPD